MSDNQRFECNHLPQDQQQPVTYQTVPQYHVEEGIVATAASKPKRKRKGRLIWLLVLLVLVLFAGIFIGVRLYPQLHEKHAKIVSYLSGDHDRDDDYDKDDSKNYADKKELDNDRKDGDTSQRKVPSFYTKEEAAQRRDIKNLSIPEIVENAKEGVVAITSDKELETQYGVMIGHSAGSGFIISEDGYVVTNEHVIHDTNNIKIVLNDGSSQSAELVGSDPLNDIAVLKMEGSGYKPVELGSSADLQVGELAVAIGNPSGNLSGTVTAGIISALEREINVQGLQMVLLQTDTAINEGNSGGALFNSRGQVIGINTAKLSMSESGKSVYEGLGFAIPIDTAKPIIDDLIEYGYVKDRAVLGIKGVSIGKQLFVGPNDFGGIYITEVIPGSAAEKADLRKGDIIISFNEQRVREPMDINNEIKKLKVGDEVKLEIYRDEKVNEITVTLGSQDNKSN